MKHVFIISFFHDIKMFLFYQINLYSIKVVVNAPVPVTTSTNIKLKCITYLLKQGLTWNHLKPPRNYLKPPETSHIKGNPNFQGILNWIIQILHYYCRKQHKNMDNSRIIEQSVAISLCSSFCLLRLALPSPSSTAGYFQFLDTVLNVTSDHSCCI